MSKIKAEQFVQLWLEACEKKESISWIAGTLGISDVSVHSLARNLRQKGVNLPKIRQPFIESTDVSRLNDVISKQWNK